MTTTTASTTATALLARPCPSCEVGLEHCHGDLVEHDDGTTTCLDGCGGPRTVHDVVVACTEVGMGCCAGAELSSVDERDVPEEPAWAA